MSKVSEQRENYCKLLGLNPFKESDESDQHIREQIEKSEAEWKKDLNSPSLTKKQRYLYGEYLKLIPDIRSTLDSPILRREEFEAARDILRRKASKLIGEAIILQGGEIVIPVNISENLAGKLNWKGIDGKTLVQASGLKTVPPPRPISNAVSNAFRMMNDLNVFSPYDLLNRLIDIPDMDLSISKVEPGCPPDTLRTAYDSVNKRINNLKNGRIPNHDTYLMTVRAVKSVISTDEGLEDLISYGRCMEVLEPAFEQMDEDSGRQFSRAYIDNLLTVYVSGTDADPELCLRLLEDYCIRRTFPANFSQAESKLDTCPRCKAMIYTGDNCFYCPCCGSALNSICPCCGRAQTSANAHCVSCGIDISMALKSAVDSESRVRNLLTGGHTEQATAELRELEDKYPSFDPLPQIKVTVHENIGRINTLLNTVMDDFMTHSYFHLKNTVADGMVDFPNLLEREDIRIRYEEAVAKYNEADRICVKAAEAPEAEARELYIQASCLCPDHPDALAKLSTYPPEGPADAEIQSDPDGIQIRYAVPEDRRGMTFCIYRNSGSAPEVDPSTVPLAEIEGWNYADQTAEPGVEYYYKIYSKRWGILSQEYAECGPGLIMREVTNVTITPSDDGLKLTYVAPAGASRVRIWRKESGSAAGEGEEAEIIHNDSGTVIDDGLEEGTTYYYLFVAEYDIDGRQERSYGSIYSGMTAVLPSPINDLAVTWDRDRACYVADWTGPRDAVLYFANSKDSVPGEHVSVKDLSTRMNRIEPLDSDDGVYRFTLPEATVTYICPTVTVGNTTVRGRECVVANLKPFRNLTKSVDDRVCRLTMDWPADADNAYVLIKGRDQEGDLREWEQRTDWDEYKAKGCLEVPLKGSVRTSVTVCAEYLIDGKELKSIGVTTDVYSGTWNKVSYTLDTESVKGDRKKTRVMVRMSCPGETIIPRCVMVSCDGHIPLRKTDGTVIWESDDPIVLVDGSTLMSFVTPKDGVDLSSMRLFFADRTDYDRFGLVHPIYRRK